MASKRFKSELIAVAEFSFAPWERLYYVEDNWLIIKDFKISMKTNRFKMTYPAFLGISLRNYGRERTFANININFPKDIFLTIQIVKLELNFMDKKKDMFKTITFEEKGTRHYKTCAVISDVLEVNALSKKIKFVSGHLKVVFKPRIKHLMKQMKKDIFQPPIEFLKEKPNFKMYCIRGHS